MKPGSTRWRAHRWSQRRAGRAGKAWRDGGDPVTRNGDVEPRRFVPVGIRGENLAALEQQRRAGGEGLFGHLFGLVPFAPTVS